MKKIIVEALHAGIKKLPKINKAYDLSFFSETIERTRDSSHGDFTSNIALRLAKSLKRNPRELANEIFNCIPKNNAIEKIEVAGPGFMNFYLDDSAYHTEIERILSNKDLIEKNKDFKKQKLLLEFVSANPTGPLHVGHGRHAAFGASLRNILEAVGYDVKSEYYVNDSGRQMDILCISVIVHILRGENQKISMPSAGYQGQYIKTISQAIEQKFDEDKIKIKELIPKIDDKDNQDQYIDCLIENTKRNIGSEKFNQIKNQSLEYIKKDIQDDLSEFGVLFDSWFSEESMDKNGELDRAIQLLKKKDYLYEKDGATWFKATDLGDEKDRVVIRKNQNKTYFTSDIVYHHNKKERGFDTLIDILGSDHHGYIARVKAGLEAMGHNPDDLDVQLVQFVSLYENGVKQAMSTRSGEFITLRQLREEVGNDAARFFYIMRSNEQHLDFDLALAKSKTSENPVYYIQYAHARIASVISQLNEKSLKYDKKSGISNLQLLVTRRERELMVSISRFSEILFLSAKNKAPHNLAQYLRDLANDFHSYYNESIILVDDHALRNARISLAISTQKVISMGLGLLGVSSPSSM